LPLRTERSAARLRLGFTFAQPRGLRLDEAGGEQAEVVGSPGRYVTQAAVTNSLVVPARSIRAVFAQLSRRQGSSENGAVAANVVRMNAARRAACRPWPTTSTVASCGPSATR